MYNYDLYLIENNYPNICHNTEFVHNKKQILISKLPNNLQKKFSNYNYTIQVIKLTDSNYHLMQLLTVFNYDKFDIKSEIQYPCSNYNNNQYYYNYYNLFLKDIYYNNDFYYNKLLEESNPNLNISVKYCIIHDPINFIFKNCISYSRKPIIKKACKCHIRKFFINNNKQIDYIDCNNDATFKITINIIDLCSNFENYKSTNIIKKKIIVCNECLYKLTTFALNLENDINIYYKEVKNNSDIKEYYNTININNTFFRINSIYNKLTKSLIKDNNNSEIIIKYDILKVMLNIIFNIKLKNIDFIIINSLINNICLFIN